MKGIAGIVYPDVFQANQSITPMLRCLQSSSEEPYTSHVYRNIEIGTCGSPMFCNEKQTIYGGLSGFLDNAEELRKELIKEGYTFSKLTDEEVIVHAYECWGPQFLAKIRGSFAIAILDQRSETLLLARDSTGKKPLYWYQDQHHFIFSNQLKSLLITGFIPQTPARDAIAAYLYFGYCPQDFTPIKDVNKLLPGYYLELKKDGSKLVQSYWSYSSFFEKRTAASQNTIVKELDNLLIEAVKPHIPDNKPVGCFISGGIGSASVAYYLHKLCEPGQVKTYSVGFQGENDEDVLAATEVAEELHLSQRRLLLTPHNFLNDFARITWHLDEPLADLNVIATWNLAKLASDQTNTVYSGMGSDELLAMHNRYSIKQNTETLKHQISRFFIPPLATWFAPMINLVSTSAAFSLVKAARADSWHIEYLNENAIFNEKAMHLAAPKLAALFDPELFLNKFYHLTRIKGSANTFLYFDVKTRMADLYIMQYEKLTSAFNLEWYSPFLNRNVVEFSATLPKPDEMGKNESGIYLKTILKNSIPDSVLNRSKVKRPHFLESWLFKSELPELFKMLQTGTLVNEGYISEEWLRQQLATPKNMSDSFHHLYALLVLEIWFKIFINRPIEAIPPEITVRELLSEN